MDSAFAPLSHHGRFPYSAITQRRDFHWPEDKRLAVYIGFNVEHFAFGEGLGAKLGAVFNEPDVLNYSWREYGNRVGAWRCLELFDQLEMPTGLITNTTLYDHCPDLLQAFQHRGDEVIAHGHSNAYHQGTLSEEQETALLLHCRERIEKESGQVPKGWLSPWIGESHLTPDLLKETGYRYTLNWSHDDQPVPMRTRNGEHLWAVPYPQEVNDIPMIIARKLDGSAFAQMIIDQFDEMLRQSDQQPLVMGIALHPYLVGQPYRLRHLRRALEHIQRHREAIWMTTPGRICDHMDTIMPPDQERDQEKDQERE